MMSLAVLGLGIEVAGEVGIFDQYVHGEVHEHFFRGFDHRIQQSQELPQDDHDGEKVDWNQDGGQYDEFQIYFVEVLSELVLHLAVYHVR